MSEDKEASPALQSLIQQSGDFEVLICTQIEGVSTPLPEKTRMLISTGHTRSALLNEGAAMAEGEVLLFLWADSRLPPDALQAIHRNYSVLPQTIGGNFHVKFDDGSWFTRQLTRFLKRWRYRGHYYGNSGIFVRKADFEAIGGFKPYSILEDLDFAHRMEKHGPTLYLPQAVLASAQKFRHQKLKATFWWIKMHLLFVLGM